MRRTLLLVFALLLAGCTSSSSGPADADGDGLGDDAEGESRIIEITTLSGVERRTVTSDARVEDEDGDGLGDGDEYARGTDPRRADTDGDGLVDGRDRTPTSTDTIAAWRAAGILEVNGTFLGEMDACASTEGQLRSTVVSSDLPFPDQLTDGEELRGWDIQVRGVSRHVMSDPCVGDTDKDGLPDHEEKRLKSDPRGSDTDNDGVLDGVDADPLWDLSVSFHDLVVSGTNVSNVRIILLLGNSAAELRWPGNASALLAVPDQSPTRDNLEVRMVVSAENAATGEPLALFDDPRGVIVTLDLFTGAATGVEADKDVLSFEGQDGSMTLRWATERR